MYDMKKFCEVTGVSTTEPRRVRGSGSRLELTTNAASVRCRLKAASKRGRQHVVQVAISIRSLSVEMWDLTPTPKRECITDGKLSGAVGTPHAGKALLRSCLFWFR